MRKINTHSKSGLFLMEMILSLLFLALAASVCIRIFAASWTNETKARNLNHIQELVVKAGEILEGTDGSPKQFLELLPGGTSQEDSLIYGFDSEWEAYDGEDWSYRMEVEFSYPTQYQKQAALAFVTQSGETLYETEIRFPVIPDTEEAAE